MKAFEIHTFTGGKWKIDSVFDDRDLAVFEAQRMEGSKRYVGVRVVEETFDEKTQQTATRTIYRGTAVDQPVAAEAPKKSSSAPRPGPAGRGAKGGQRRARGPQKTASSGSSNTTLIVLFSVIIVVGAALMFGLRFFADK